MNSDPIIPSGIGERLSQFHRVQELSLLMLESAQAAEWDRVIALEEERNHLVRTLLSTPLPEEIRQALAETLSATLTLSQAINAIAEKARNVAAHELCEFRRRKHADAAYSSTG